MAHRYRAFISYSHKDVKWAKWLTRKLETYKPPSALRTDNRHQHLKLKPVFRDREELSASHSLGEKIKDALANSDYLIVLCSPASAQSKWVNQEIIEFTRLHGAENILAVIIDGEPFAQAGGDEPSNECFPEYLRYRLTNDGELTPEQAEPCAADFRKQGDGKSLGLQKLAAGMLGVGLDALVRRDNARRMKTVTLVTVASLAGMLVTTSLAYFAVQGQREAREQRAEAEGLIEFMLTDLRDKLEPVGRLDVLQSVGQKIDTYYITKRINADRDNIPSQGSQKHRVKTYHLLGDIDLRRSDFSSAKAKFDKAYALTEKAMLKQSVLEQEIFEHSQSAYWVGYAARQLNDFKTAEKMFILYRDLAENLVEKDPDNHEWQLELAYSLSNLGTLYIDREDGNLDYVDKLFQKSLEIFELLAAKNPTDVSLQIDLADGYAWVAQTHELKNQYNEAIAYRYKENKTLLNLLAVNENKDNWGLKRDLAGNRFAIGRLYSALNNDIKSVEYFNLALLAAENLIAHDSANVDWLQFRNRVKNFLEKP